MQTLDQFAAGLTDMEREWITGWQGPAGAAFNCIAGDLFRKGLLKGRTDWNLNEAGLALRDHLNGRTIRPMSVRLHPDNTFGKGEHE